MLENKTENLVSCDSLRAKFAKSLSLMYRKEVPLYGNLIDLVESVNKKTLNESKNIAKKLAAYEDLDRISNERHGAIRLSSPHELKTIKRIFAVFGMFPVGYYDLTQAAMPVHSTAFRPIDQKSLALNPFRVFTSLLRLDLIKDKKLRQTAQEIINKRQIFTKKALKLLEIAEKNSGLNQTEGDEFILEVMETFRWHSNASVSYKTYNNLLTSHRLIADILSFKGPHINHLTPRTLDIDLVQELMPKNNIDAKAVIEGPPLRNCPILLRQTSFKALSEKVSFKSNAGKNGTSSDDLIEGFHTARFGEIEQRGVALTKKGRSLYDKLLLDVRKICIPKADGKNKKEYNQALTSVFLNFPDDYETLRKEKLAYFSYFETDKAKLNNDEFCKLAKCKDLNKLIDERYVAYHPITYEDFLPVSAAGIFESNLGDEERERFVSSPNQSSFEIDLADKVYDEFKLYQDIQNQTINSIYDHK